MEGKGGEKEGEKKGKASAEDAKKMAKKAGIEAAKDIPMPGDKIEVTKDFESEDAMKLKKGLAGDIVGMVPDDDTVQIMFKGKTETGMPMPMQVVPMQAFVPKEGTIKITENRAADEAGKMAEEGTKKESGEAGKKE